jgi:Domain of unknown function (DUF4928)
MSSEENAIRVIDDWYKGLDLYQDKLPSKGSIAAALHILERLKTNFDLDISSHVAGGEAQITGLSGATLKKILATFGEHRPLSTIGGRSNRGARGDTARLLQSIQPLHLEKQSIDERNQRLNAMQGRLVHEYIGLYFSVKRVKATFDQNTTTRRFVRTIIENATLNGKGGPVAEYLVGAKLALRFPQMQIRNKRFATSDSQGGFSGDFEIGNTVFHITTAPMPELYDKCRANLERGLRIYLIVPDSIVVGARQNAELVATGRIAVESIESFIATNIDELSEFDGDNLKSGFLRLLEKYNHRVSEVEPDKSMLIEIPANLS